jgi:hypothetical protein
MVVGPPGVKGVLLGTNVGLIGGFLVYRGGYMGLPSKSSKIPSLNPTSRFQKSNDQIPPNKEARGIYSTFLGAHKREEFHMGVSENGGYTTQMSIAMGE